MAGSIRWFRYTDDSGTPYAILRDESNTEIVNSGADVALSVPAVEIPKNLVPRTVRIAEPGGKISREITVLSVTRFNQLNGTVPIVLGEGDIDSGVTMTVKSKTGESFSRFPFSNDTGKDDGDNP